MKPRLIYNSRCRFCKDTAKWLLRRIGKENLEIVPNSNVDRFIYHVNQRDRFKKDVHLIIGYKIYSAHKAIIKVLLLDPQFKKYKNILQSRWFNGIMNVGYKILKKIKSFY